MNYEPLEKVRKLEAHFSKYARRSTECVGRKNSFTPDRWRTEFERDCHRTLHSLPFRRLRHKTQVFFAPKNDHICTRMEHALHVASIASTICNHLDLNATLAEAISLAHDLGHPPFGHLGERALDEIHKRYKLPPFVHEAQSLRVIDHFKDRAHNYTLNLTFEVRDGVVCHYGESDEQSLQPDRGKNIKAVEPDAARKQNPGTLEGCVVRMSDRIAYLGRDFEDAVEAGIIKQDTLPRDVECSLGESNSEIIGTLIHDVIQQSKGLDKIQLSDEKFASYAKLKQFNAQKIYNSRKLTSQSHRIRIILKNLFDLFYEVTQKTKCGQGKRDLYDGYMHKVFYEFLDDMQYSDEEADAQIVSDFVTGMTDNFALRAFQELFFVSSPV